MCGSEDAKIFIWDLQTRQVLQVLEGHRGTFFRCAAPQPTELYSRIDVVLAVAVSTIMSHVVSSNRDYRPTRRRTL